MSIVLGILTFILIPVSLFVHRADAEVEGWRDRRGVSGGGRSRFYADTSNVLVRATKYSAISFSSRIRALGRIYGATTPVPPLVAPCRRSPPGGDRATTALRHRRGGDWLQPFRFRRRRLRPRPRLPPGSRRLPPRRLPPHPPHPWDLRCRRSRRCQPGCFMLCSPAKPLSVREFVRPSQVSWHPGLDQNRSLYRLVLLASRMSLSNGLAVLILARMTLTGATANRPIIGQRPKNPRQCVQNAACWSDAFDAQTAPAIFWRAFSPPPALAARGACRQPSGSGTGRQTGPEEAARFWPNSACRRGRRVFFEFELRARRGGERSRLQGRLWGRTLGPAFASNWPMGVGRRLLIQNGELASAAPGRQAVANGRCCAFFTHGACGVSAFDLQMPFLYWPDATSRESRASSADRLMRTFSRCRRNLRPDSVRSWRPGRFSTPNSTPSCRPNSSVPGAKL